MAVYEARFPMNCGEGWSIDALWRGLRLLEVVERAGGTAGSQIRVRSLEQAGPFNKSVIFGPQLSRALLATHLNGERLTVDHGYPLRLIAPNRACRFNIKWLASIEVLS
jgi:DMSO/TMAO reductase YedYZ molybdopterin-dependent catalytic subunit